MVKGRCKSDVSGIPVVVGDNRRKLSLSTTVHHLSCDFLLNNHSASANRGDCVDCVCASDIALRVRIVHWKCNGLTHNISGTIIDLDFVSEGHVGGG